MNIMSRLIRVDRATCTCIRHERAKAEREILSDTYRKYAKRSAVEVASFFSYQHA